MAKPSRNIVDNVDASSTINDEISYSYKDKYGAARSHEISHSSVDQSKDINGQYQPPLLKRWLKDRSGDPYNIYRNPISQGKRPWRFLDKVGDLEAILSGLDLGEITQARRESSEVPLDGSDRKRKADSSSKSVGTNKKVVKQSFPTSLDKEITDPSDSNGVRILEGCGVYNATTRSWEFMCYWFKRFPTDHQDCSHWHSQLERSVRKDHAREKHKFVEGRPNKPGHVQQSVLDDLAKLPTLLVGQYNHLGGRDKEIALWQEGFVRVFPEFLNVRHLLNPFGVGLFTDEQDALLILRDILPAFVQSREASNVARLRSAMSTETPTVATAPQTRPPLSRTPESVAETRQPISISGTRQEREAHLGEMLHQLRQDVRAVESLAMQLHIPLDPQLLSQPTPGVLNNTVASVPAIAESEASRRELPQSTSYVPASDQHQAVTTGDVERPTSPPQDLLRSDDSQPSYVSMSEVAPSRMLPSLTSGRTGVSTTIDFASPLIPGSPLWHNAGRTQAQIREIILPDADSQDKTAAESAYLGIGSPDSDLRFDSPELEWGSP